ncbi:MAG: alpha-ketoglutarate-dependent dioxygenase AlkB family protein [Arenicella sp.]
MMDLFAELSGTSNRQMGQLISLPNAELQYFPALFDQDSSDSNFEYLLNDVAWAQEHITLYGKTNKVPRLSAWYGDAAEMYTYSGITSKALPWTDLLLHIKRDVESVTGALFNSVLVNLYRDGADSVAWHSDDEPELGENPTIASVSFGQIRPFQLRMKHDHRVKYSLDLAHGSCLLMSGQMQAYWQHQIAKSKKITQARINLTFRMIK